ncbi:tRNA delta2-isopentenylpyrophosphate transferase [Moraxella catarrhalis]|nr:tRNA delta2-isopentenylpyrophosphate transferase [Moraxella catarrhalis]OAV18525.1 tRNA delta2-isopentenylpyrophosphate transferase [Moraxella catarrhalis]OAV23769.1 tRNA delta2-isopentenylpyrophosphate transferase [Moraxella catarrhalis]OAV27111.1 tRNA delta2-isopentenylpyrophosphate transferase [Moraxella catarrhalis]OAV31281.1 tRNA delta2-isopentenylpyrophosphate transferase [Moraxella catarrhalis]
MKNKALYATRQLAKRQYTWLKQLAQIDKPTKNNLIIVSFNSTKQVEQQFLQ